MGEEEKDVRQGRRIGRPAPANQQQGKALGGPFFKLAGQIELEDGLGAGLWRRGGGRRVLMLPGSIGGRPLPIHPLQRHPSSDCLARTSLLAPGRLMGWGRGKW
ncbi:unnamed protein product [Urochloa humidicola]